MNHILFWVSAFLIFYAYAGYPILVTLLSRFRRRPVYTLPGLPTVTLLLAAYNEEKVMSQKMENSLLLDYPRDHLQILVADDGSTDQTTKIVKSYADRGIQLVSYPDRMGKLSTLNRAVKKAKNQIILFSDSDNFFPPDTIQQIVKYFADPLVGAVSGGRNVIGSNALGGAEGVYWKYEEFIKLQESRLSSCVGVAGDLLAIRSELYNPPPSHIINDDFYMALSIMKQGYRVVYAPEARSFHPVASSENGEMERRARMVAGRYQTMFLAWRMLPFRNPVVLWQVISHKFLRPLVPFAMIVMFLANLFALLQQGPWNGPAMFLLAPPYALIFLIMQLIFYFLGVLGKRYKFGGVLGKILYLPTFLLNSNVAALLGFYRFLTDKQTVMWKKVRESA